MSIRFPNLQEIVVNENQSIGALALSLYQGNDPANRLTPQKWLAVYLPNRSLDPLWPDPNAMIPAGTAVRIPQSPPYSYPSLIDAVYYNATFGFRVRLAQGWQVDEEGETAVRFTHPSQSHHYTVKIVQSDSNLHNSVDKIIAELMPNNRE
jgi:hypothetical protein